MFTALDTHVNYTHQRWESGLKLFDASARAKARVKVTHRLRGDVAASKTACLLPDLVIELKVTKADVKYDNLKFEHIAGIGGDAAQLIGELAHAALTQWRPSIEKDALAKANAAIIKAGQHKEVRLSLAKLFKPTPRGEVTPTCIFSPPSYATAVGRSRRPRTAAAESHGRRPCRGIRRTSARLRLAMHSLAGTGAFGRRTGRATEPRSGRKAIDSALAVQDAMRQGREFLQHGQAKSAVDVLEAQLPRINGNAAYLGLLREAYAAYVKELRTRPE